MTQATIERIKKDRRVEFVDDERACGNGVIVTLKQGWTWDALCDNRVRGEDTASGMLRVLSQAKPFSGPYDE